MPKRQQAPAATIELAYDPLMLPTAQHRAGLAGLLVLRESLVRRKEDGWRGEHGREIGPLPEYTVDDGGIVRLTLSLDSLQTLFNDLFDVAWDPRTSKTAPKGSGFRHLETITVEPPDGKGKPSQQFEYTVMVPKAEFLTALGVPENWRKLWRDAIWATVRGRPKSRIPYEQASAGGPVNEAKKLWADLTNKKLGANRPSDLGEPLLIGSQSKTADGVPYEGTARETLLLYFWPVATIVGQARQIKTERKEGHTRTLEDDTGFVFAVPDVSDPDFFSQLFPLVLRALKADTRGNDYRPSHGVWALPQEGALEYLYHLLHLATSDAATAETCEAVTGIEVFQLMKRGNNIPILSVGRVEASRALAGDYAKVRTQIWSPIFRAQRLLNLLRDHTRGDVPWYRDFDKVFQRYDPELFAGEAAGPFAHDARVLFEE
jgi:CRISPR-associated protein Cmx8